MHEAIFESEKHSGFNPFCQNSYKKLPIKNIHDGLKKGLNVCVYFSQQKRKEFRIFFDEIFAGTSTKAIRVEFEEYELPHRKQLRNGSHEQALYFYCFHQK